jgi:hypothetical protein
MFPVATQTRYRMLCIGWSGRLCFGARPDPTSSSPALTSGEAGGHSDRAAALSCAYLVRSLPLIATVQYRVARDPEARRGAQAGLWAGVKISCSPVAHRPMDGEARSRRTGRSGGQLKYLGFRSYPCCRECGAERERDANAAIDPREVGLAEAEEARTWQPLPAWASVPASAAVEPLTSTSTFVHI